MKNSSDLREVEAGRMRLDYVHGMRIYTAYKQGVAKLELGYVSTRRRGKES